MILSLDSTTAQKDAPTSIEMMVDVCGGLALANRDNVGHFFMTPSFGVIAGVTVNHPRFPRDFYSNVTLRHFVILSL